MRKVIFVQSKLPDNPRSLLQIAERWNSYGKSLQKQGGPDGILIFTPTPLNEIAKSILDSKCVEQFPSVGKEISAVLRFNALIKQIKAEKLRCTLVCGDNQQSLLIALAIKLCLRSLVRIQIQFHGDTYSFRSNKGFKGFIRVCLSRLGIFTADSIRIVSGFQAEEIRKLSKRAEDKFVLAPIPIDFSRVATSSTRKSFDVAFVGRLHSERGIVDLIRIIRLLKIQRPHTTVTIVGEGSLKSEIQSELSNWIQDSTISMPGFLVEDQIRDIYASTKVLISTAPKEGYGLTLREAALSGVHVIARESKGSLETKESFPSRIETFANINDAVRLIQNYLAKQSLEQSTDDVAFQLEADFESLDRLTKSWVDN